MSSATDIPRVYHGAYGLCRDPSDRLLLVRISGGLDEGRWAMPGGGIEWGEHPDAALLRELEEETGIVNIKEFRVTAMYSHVYERSQERPYEPVQHIGVIYDVTLGQFNLRPEKDGTTDQCKWFSENVARQLPLTPIGKFAINLTWPKS